MLFISIKSQMVLTTVPVRNYNNIDSISSVNSQITFHSSSGKIIYNSQKDNFVIDTTQSKFKSKRDIRFEWSKDIPIEIAKVIGGPYQSLIDSATIDQYGRFLLFKVAGESAVFGMQYLINTSNKLVYEFRDNTIKCFFVNKDNVFLGGQNGIIKINKQSNSVSKSVILPIFDKFTSFYENEQNIWLTTDKLYIQMISKNGDEFSFWDPSLIVNKDISNPLYSDIIEVNEHILFSCTDSHRTGSLYNQETHLLIYYIKDSTWLSIPLERIKGIAQFFTKDKLVFIGGHYVLPEEGGEYATYGGFGYFNFSDTTITIIEDIPSDEAVTKIIDSENGLEIETYKPSMYEKKNIKKYFFDFTSKSVQLLSEEAVPYKELKETRIIIPMLRETRLNYEINMKKFESMLITPKVINKQVDENYFRSVNY